MCLSCLSCMCCLNRKCYEFCYEKCCKKCCKDVSLKRYFIPFIFAPIACIHQSVVNYIYLPIIIGLSAFVLFWNFPKLVYYTASRPLYYEDLFIDEKKLPNYDVNPNLKNKFQTILEWILVITNAILVSALADYWLYKTIGDFTTLEILGITGGIIKIFQIVNNTVSRIMLKILKIIIRRENKKIQEKQTDQIKEIMNIKLKISEQNETKPEDAERADEGNTDEENIDPGDFELIETKDFVKRGRINNI